MKMEQTECSEMSAYKIQTPGNYPEENIQHSEHGKSLKSRIMGLCYNYSGFDTFIQHVTKANLRLSCFTLLIKTLGKRTFPLHWRE